VQLKAYFDCSFVVQVTVDKDGDLTPWSADWHQHQAVEEFYGSVEPADPILENQFALYMKMRKIFNPSGCVPLSDRLQQAMQKADEFRTRNYEEEKVIFLRDISRGRSPEACSPPALWSDDHHSNVIRCLLNLPVILGQQSDTMLLRLLQRALIDAEQKSTGGITEEDIDRAIDIEFEIFTSSCVCCL
jgi:hypothetical protein